MLDAPSPEAEALSAIGRAAAVLRANDEGDGWLDAVAAALLQSGDVFKRLTGIENANGESKRAKAARAIRDRALRSAAKVRYGDIEKLSEKARLMSRALGNYRVSAWREERKAKANPHAKETFRFWLWEALQAIDSRLSQKQIERIFSDTGSG